MKIANKQTKSLFLCLMKPLKLNDFSENNFSIIFNTVSYIWSQQYICSLILRESSDAINSNAIEYIEFDDDSEEYSLSYTLTNIQYEWISEL